MIPHVGEALSNQVIADLPNTVNYSRTHFTSMSLQVEADRTIQDEDLLDDQQPAKKSKTQPDVVQIYVETDDERTFTLDVAASHTIGSVKSQIQDTEGIPICNQIFRFCGYELNDCRTLSSYNIQHRSTMKLRVSFNIDIQPLNGESSFSLRVAASDTIWEVKHKIYRLHDHITPNMPRLAVGTQYLEDRHTLRYYNIENTSTLSMVLVDTFELIIHDLVHHPFCRYPLEVNCRDTIAQVKNVIAQKINVPSDVQSLTSVTEEGLLEDDVVLNDLDLEFGLRVSYPPHFNQPP